MKRLSIFLVCIFLSAFSFNTYAQNQLSFTAGYAYASVTSNSTSTKSEGKDNGAYVGILAEMPIYRITNLYFEPGLIYFYCGSKSGSVSEAIHTANVPLRFKYKVHLSDQLAIFGFGGPVASMGIAANISSNGRNYSMYGDDGIMTRFDIKLGVGAGVELSQLLSFRFGYDWGLLNASKITGMTSSINYLHVGVALNI